MVVIIKQEILKILDLDTCNEKEKLKNSDDLVDWLD